MSKKKWKKEQCNNNILIKWIHAKYLSMQSMNVIAEKINTPFVHEHCWWSGIHLTHTASSVQMCHVPSVQQLYVVQPRVLGSSLVHYLSSLRTHMWMHMYICINIWKPLAQSWHRTMSIFLFLIILLSCCTPDSALGILQLNPGTTANKWSMKVVLL